MKTNKFYMPPEKILKEIENGNIQVTTKGIRDWIKFLAFIVMLILQGAGLYYAIKLEMQSLTINQEFMKVKNLEQDEQLKDIKKELREIYQNKK